MMTPDRAADGVTAASGAALVRLLGVDGAPGVDVDALVSTGFLAEGEVTNFGVPVADVGVDVFSVAVMLGTAMAGFSASPDVKVAKAWDDVTRMRGASLGKWADRLRYRLRYRQKTGGPSIVTAGKDAPAYLTPAEAGAWFSARTRAAGYVTAISDAAREDVRDMVREAIEDQVGKDVLRQRLEAVFGASSRDWNRVAVTELQAAYNESVLANAIAGFGKQAKIARVPESNACVDCKRLYLAGGRPIIWDARDIISNGANAGKRREDWKATVWPMHPHCRCDTVSVPPGYTFDDSWNLVPEKDA